MSRRKWAPILFDCKFRNFCHRKAGGRDSIDNIFSSVDTDEVSCSKVQPMKVRRLVWMKQLQQK